MTAARDYEHDEWIPWYVEDTPGWLELSLRARGAMAEIARKLNRAGTLRLRRGLPSLALLLRLDWDTELGPAIDELLAAGKVTWDEATATLADPDYTARKRKGSADRMREHRERKRGQQTPDAIPDQISEEIRSDKTRTAVTSVTVTPVTRVTSPPSQPGEPPAWFGTAVEVVAMNTGVTLPIGEAWLRYDGHRAGKGIEPTAKDAQYWLTTVMVPEAREQLRQKSRDEARDRAFAAERTAKLGVAPKPEDSRKTFREREDWAKSAGPPDPETAAKMKKLMGGIGR